MRRNGIERPHGSFYAVLEDREEPGTISYPRSLPLKLLSEQLLVDTCYYVCTEAGTQRLSGDMLIDVSDEQFWLRTKA